MKKVEKKIKENIFEMPQKLIEDKLGEKKGKSGFVQGILLPRKVVLQIADEVAKRLKRKKNGNKKIITARFEKPIFLDTSAIIDGRLFDLIKLGIFEGNLILLESILSELKNIADSKDDIKKERGRRALRMLDEIKKQKNIKLITFRKEEEEKSAVDDQVIEYAKKHKGKIITCDFNLSKKAKIEGVLSIDIHEVANVLKTQAVPGDSFWIKLIQKGKGEGQGVGYLPDGTMIVVEQGADYLGKTLKVGVSRIIQTDAGKILFAKIKEEE
ncbi:MAG: hypothetical protein A2857_03830 [Candidatus Levybacteria bacterium RIFCSPHIGHO2_01_FULL_36_15]|nr:MAG: hypothetical protein A2857_03830 [Candidatus Levybacteria bacterium RIFCSPHIGHO2_01_FULL_36_15]OGH38727.1 MAG: hypothetical protein A2905_03675 [Candidatus Levybacteria bacterium RIFCSPLOWO2_01_FULL_36_10]